MTALTSSLHAQPGPARKTRGHAETLTILSIWLLAIGYGPVREALGQTEIVSFNAYTFHSVDPSIIVAGMAALAQLFKGKLRFYNFTLPILVMAVLVIFNFLRGVMMDNPAALVWMRSNGGLAAILVLALVMRPSVRIIEGVRLALIVSSLALSVLVLLRLGTRPTLFMTAEGVTDLNANDGGRALSAAGTYIMALTSGLLASELLQRGRFTVTWLNLFTLALPVLIILTRQGTVTIAAFAMLTTIFIFQRGKGQRERVLIGVAAAAFLLLLLLVILPALADNATLAQRAVNLQTRQKVWTALMDWWPQTSVFTQLFGLPAGQPPAIVIYANDAYRQWDHGIHSMYYGSLPIMGYVGAACYVATLILLSVQSFALMRRRLNPIPAYPFAFCVGIALLSYSYEIHGESLISLFAAIWWLRLARDAQARQRGPERGTGAGRYEALTG